MQLKKEYPATHSMETAWFIVDEKGEVAIFQFEEEGPEPLTEEHLSSTELLYFLVQQNSQGAYQIQFNEEQLNEIIVGLKEPDTDMIKCLCNVQIDPNKIEFLKAHGAELEICFSKEKGLYFLEWWTTHNDNNFEEILQRAIDEKVIIKACPCEFDLYLEDFYGDQPKHRLTHFPFYIYKQPYEQTEITERVVIPKHPFREEQIPEAAKKYVLHLPVKFSETEKIQPAEFFDSECWYTRNHFKEVNGVTYMQIPLTKGGYAYVKLLTSDAPSNWEEMPRLIDFSNEYIKPQY